MGRGGASPRQGGAPADPAFDRLLGLPLVPRDGAGVLRERTDGGAHERALRLREGRSRGAPGSRRDLHGGHAGPEFRPGRLAHDGLPHAGAGAFLRRHLLPPAGRARAPRVPLAAHADRGGLARSAGSGPGGGPVDHGSPAAAGRRHTGHARQARRVCKGGDAARGGLRPGVRRLRWRAEVPPRHRALPPPSPPSPHGRRERAAHGDAHAHLHGTGRDLRSDRWRLRALRDR